MLERITFKEEIKLLETLGIEVRDGRLIQLSTGMEFYPVKSEMQRFGSFWYSCGSTLIQFHVVDGIPSSITIIDKGLEYYLWKNKSGSECLKINRNATRAERDRGKVETNIKIDPMCEDDYIKTSITYEEDSFQDIAGLEHIYGTFNSIEVGKNREYYGELNQDNYKSALEDTINKLFEDTLVRDEYLKCSSILCDGFTELLSHPLHNKDGFINYYNHEIDVVNADFAQKVTNVSNDNDYEIREVRETMDENALVFVSEAVDFQRRIKELVAEKQKRLDNIDQRRRALDDYITNYVRYKSTSRGSRR